MTTKSTLCGSIVATIKERVITWQYPPEHRLTEEALSREFNVSRSPVREAGSSPAWAHNAHGKSRLRYSPSQCPRGRGDL